jgi:hypothetical protein
LKVTGQRPRLDVGDVIVVVVVGGLTGWPPDVARSAEKSKRPIFKLKRIWARSLIRNEKPIVIFEKTAIQL